MDYIAASVFRLLPADLEEGRVKEAYEAILKGETVQIDEYVRQHSLLAAGNQ